MNTIFGMEAGGLVVILDKFGVNVPLLAIQTVNFLLVAYLIYHFAFRGVIKTMDERNKKIQDGLQYGEKMKHELASIENKRSNIINQANNKASEIVGDAQKNATELLERGKQESKELAKSILSKAKIDIQNKREAMFDSLKGEIKEIVVRATEQVLSRELTDGERERYRTQAVQTLTQLA